jgi:hypothetical protein
MALISSRFVVCVVSGDRKNPEFLIKILSSGIKTNGPSFCSSCSLTSTVPHNGPVWSWFEGWNAFFCYQFWPVALIIITIIQQNNSACRYMSSTARVLRGSHPKSVTPRTLLKAAKTWLQDKRFDLTCNNFKRSVLKSHGEATRNNPQAWKLGEGGVNNLSTYKLTGQGTSQNGFGLLEFTCQILINEGQTLRTPRRKLNKYSQRHLHTSGLSEIWKAATTNCNCGTTFWPMMCVSEQTLKNSKYIGSICLNHIGQ